jgi:hypothetical protein
VSDDTDSIETVAELLAAFDGWANGRGRWFFPFLGGAYRLDHAPDSLWVVGFIKRNRYRRRVALATEQMAARYLVAMLNPPGEKNPPVRAVDEFFSREDRYSLGRDGVSGRHYVAFPVTIGVVDYDEYYALTDDHYALLLSDPSAALEFVNECRNHEHDELLLQKPGWNRGVPM